MISVSVLLVLGFLVSNAFGDGNSGYFVKDLSDIPCIESPLKDICNVDHKVPDPSRMPGHYGRFNKTEFQISVSEVLAIFNASGGNATCLASVKSFMCSIIFLPCKEDQDYLSQNYEDLVSVCEKASRDCNVTSPSLVESFLTCAVRVKRKPKIPRRGICSDFPDVENDPYPCKMRNFKVPVEANVTLALGKQLEIHQKLKEHEANISKECRSKVAEAVCKIVAPACTKDKKKVIAFLSKQECEKTMACLNTTKMIGLEFTAAFMRCKELPDETKAKKVDLSNVYTDPNKATMQGMTSKILLFVFPFIAVHFVYLI